MAKLIEVILTDELRGTGTEQRPFYRQLQLWTKEGVLICKANPKAFVLGENSLADTSEEDWVSLEALTQLQFEMARNV